MSAPIVPPARIALIGLGRMGMPMARRLLGAGFAVHGADPAPAARDALVAAGGVATDSVAGAAAGADALIAMLPDGDVVRAALLGPDGALTTLPTTALVIDMSSSAPMGTRGLGDDLAALGFALIDAPVSGGVARAVTGALTIMAGGDAADIARAAPIFDALGREVFETGALGSGHAMKALNNYVSGAGAAAAMEALTIGRAFGLDPDRMVDVLNVSTGRNNTTEVKLRQFVLSQSYGSGFGIGLMAKDIRLAAALAQSLRVGTGFVDQVARQWEAGRDALGASADHTELARHIDAPKD
ncbi:MAG: 3-hydroxyisobutyrate dehydrogenase [Paracoccaceae bacterium]|jgi:3-hydroxyisobutyrate dehydrogenase